MQPERQGQAIESTGTWASRSHTLLREFAKFAKACRPTGGLRPSEFKGKGRGDYRLRLRRCRAERGARYPDALHREAGRLKGHFLNNKRPRLIWDRVDIRLLLRYDARYGLSRTQIRAYKLPLHY